MPVSAATTFNNTGFQVTYSGGSLAHTNVPVLLQTQDFTPGASGFTGETDKGGPVDNGGTVSATGDHAPVVTVPGGATIPLRTPFALTGSATDEDGDPIYYSWEQNDPGIGAGISLLSNTKANGPLFAMFPLSAPVSDQDTLLYNSPHENHITTIPTRVFPDLDQILANNTNADTGSCAAGPIAPPVPIPVKECFSEFLPTSDYTQSALHFRLTARDLQGGNSFGDVTLTTRADRGPVPRHLARHARHVSARLSADGHVEQGEHRRPAGLDCERCDLALDRRRAHVSDRALREHAERRIGARDAPADGDDDRAGQGRGGRERLLRRLEHELHDLGRAASAATATTTPTATAASATATSTASSAPPPPPVRCRVPRVLGLRLGAAKTKIRRAHCSVGNVRRVRSQPLAARPRGQPVTAARHDQAPELPGQAGGRQDVAQRELQRGVGSQPAPLSATPVLAEM